MTKRILSLLLALLLVVSVLPVSTYAEDATDDLGYKDRKVKFVYDLNVSNDPESELDWSAAKQIPLSEIPADFVAVIAATKVLESRDELWFQIKAQTDQELPAVFGENTWVFQDKVTTPVGATMILDCEICGDFECTAVHVKCPDCGEYDCGGHTEPEKPGLTDPETSVQVAADNLPADVELRVKPADVSQQLAQFYIPAENLVFALDISLTQNGQTYQTPATVKVPVDATPGTKIGILHTHGDETSYLGMVEVAADNTVEFQTDGFSEFAGFMVVLRAQEYDVTVLLNSNDSTMVSSLLVRILGEDIANNVEITSVVFGGSGLTVTEKTNNGKRDWELLIPAELPEGGINGTLTIQAVGYEISIRVTSEGADYVTFDFNDGSDRTRPVPVKDGFGYNSEVDWLEPSRNGYDFGGWYTGKDGNGTMVYNADGQAVNCDYWENARWQGTDNLTVYAYWIAKTYTATFILESGGTLVATEVPFTIADSSALNTYLQQYERSADKLRKWIITETAEESSWTSGAIYGFKDANNPRVLFATSGCWGDVTVVSDYAIKADFTDGWRGNNRNNKSATFYVLLGTGDCSDLTYLEPARTGYEFLGWYDAKTGGNKIYYGEQDAGKTSGIGVPNSPYWDGDKKWRGPAGATVYAHWSDPIVYTIGYDLAGGSLAEGVSNPTSYDVTSNSIVLKQPTRQGYTFAGWTGTDLTGATMEVTIPTGSTENRSYTANWTANSYTVTFDANGGSVAQATATVTYDAAYGTLPTPSREGHSFLGWFTAKEGGVQVTEQTVYKTAGNSTLYAQWERTNADLTIQVSNASADQNYIFIVSNADQSIQRSIVVKGSSSVTIADLPVGKYTVTPLSGWVWRQNVTVADNSADLTKGDQKITFGCSIIDGLKYWLNGYGYGKGT